MSCGRASRWPPRGRVAGGPLRDRLGRWRRGRAGSAGRLVARGERQLPLGEEAVE